MTFHPNLPAIGYQSKALIHFYASNGFKKRMSHIQEKYTFLDEFVTDIQAVHFLNQQTLRDDLSSFLRDRRMPESLIQAAIDMPKENVSIKSQAKKNQMDDSLRAKIRTSEWLYVEVGQRLGFE